MDEEDEKKGRLDSFGVRGIVVGSFGILLGFALLLISAGKLDWANAWVYIGLTTAYQIISTVVLVKINPEMLNERGRFVKQGTKPFDKVYVALYLPIAYSIVVVIGLDARYKWSTVPLWASVLGVVMALAAFSLGIWAMAVNPYFECTVRIQDDRDQRVITSGPYGIVRHPGYAALVLSALSYPLILGSWWGFLPTGVIVLIVLIRTALEDRTLQKELPGYEEYSGSTRYRLLPLIW